jgi:hypothetical protein
MVGGFSKSSRHTLLLRRWQVAPGVAQGGASRERAALRFFLGQQLQKQLPLDIIFGISESSFEDDQVFAVYKVFHSVLLSGGRSFSLDTGHSQTLDCLISGYSLAFDVKDASGTSNA